LEWLSDDWEMLGRENDASLLSGLSLRNYTQLRDMCVSPPPPTAKTTPPSTPESLFDIYSRVPSKTHRDSTEGHSQRRSRRLDWYLEGGEEVAPLALPTDTLREVMKYLTAADLHQLSCSHSFFKRHAAGIIPGLRLTLYSHQHTSGAYSETDPSCFK
jgi:hypothetical protein